MKYKTKNINLYVVQEVCYILFCCFSFLDINYHFIISPSKKNYKKAKKKNELRIFSFKIFFLV
jgi:hypothetical protein